MVCIVYFKLESAKLCCDSFIVSSLNSIWGISINYLELDTGRCVCVLSLCAGCEREIARTRQTTAAVRENELNLSDG